jgi:hypothetical protein
VKIPASPTIWTSKFSLDRRNLSKSEWLIENSNQLQPVIGMKSQSLSMEFMDLKTEDLPLKHFLPGSTAKQVFPAIGHTPLW